MAKLTRRKIILVGIETVAAGTAVVPTIPVMAYDVDIKPTAPWQPRKPVGATIGHKLGSIGEYVGTCSFKTELRKDASAGLDDGVSVLLQCCGFKLTTLTYAPCSAVADQKTCTIYVYEDGLLKKLYGAMGNVSFDGEFGKFIMLSFDMSGAWLAPTDVALPAITHDATMPPRLAGATFTLGAWAPKCSKFSLNMNNEVVPREDIAAASGVLHYCIVDRDPVVTIDPEQTTVAAHDMHGLWLAGTTAALTLAAGGITIAAPKLQLREVPEGDRAGKLTDEVTAQCVESAATGDDEVTIVTA